MGTYGYWLDAKVGGLLKDGSEFARIMGELPTAWRLAIEGRVKGETVNKRTLNRPLRGGHWTVVLDEVEARADVARAAAQREAEYEADLARANEWREKGRAVLGAAWDSRTVVDAEFGVSSVVVESPYYGRVLLVWRAIPCERFDAEKTLEFSISAWYADFHEAVREHGIPVSYNPSEFDGLANAIGTRLL